MIVTGDISSTVDHGYTAPNDAITGQVNYKREFKIDASGVTITSTLTSDGKDQVKELWETIPLYLGSYYYMSKSKTATVDFKVGDTWEDGSTTLTSDVSAVRINRFKGSVVINFARPVHLKLTSVRRITYQSAAITQNVLIDLLDGTSGTTQLMPKQTSVTYTIASSLAKAINDNSTPIEGTSGSNLPAKIELKQNYPNPFNPTTNIGFALNKASVVTMKVFDILGRLVSIPLENKAMSAGSHNIIFDGSNLASGVYIYRLTTGQNNYIKKMTLIK